MADVASLPGLLVDEVHQLKREGFTLEVVGAEDWANVIFHGYPVPLGFSKSTTELLLRLPISYPHGRPDMFWTDEDLVLADGAVPKNADSIETGLGKRWRRFSWHLANWNPASDNLRTYLEFVNRRLRQAE